MGCNVNPCLVGMLFLKQHVQIRNILIRIRSRWKHISNCQQSTGWTMSRTFSVFVQNHLLPTWMQLHEQEYNACTWFQNQTFHFYETVQKSVLIQSYDISILPLLLQRSKECSAVIILRYTMLPHIGLLEMIHISPFNTMWRNPCICSSKSCLLIVSD